MTQYIEYIRYSLIGALIIMLVILIPIGVIWAINTLFGMEIEVNLINWLSVFILIGVFRGTK